MSGIRARDWGWHGRPPEALPHSQRRLIYTHGMFAHALVLTLLFTPAIALALDVPTPPGWTEGKRSDNLILFYKDNEALHTREILAYSEIDATPEAVFKVVTDFERWPQFMPTTKAVKIVKRASADEFVMYELISPPLVSDRDFYLQVKLTHGTSANGGVFKSQWTCLPDFGPEQEGIIRMRINEGSWTYEPVDGGKRTRVAYLQVSHPGGSIPNWIVHRSTLSIIPDLFQAVRKRLGVK